MSSEETLEGDGWSEGEAWMMESEGEAKVMATGADAATGGEGGAGSGGARRDAEAARDARGTLDRREVLVASEGRLEVVVAEEVKSLPLLDCLSADFCGGWERA